MKLCRYNYFLKQNENIICTTDCILKSYINYQILNDRGKLVASDFRLLFCLIVGDHPHLVQDFEYRYITNMEIKGELHNKYLYFKYNGNSVKINELIDEDLNKLVNVISIYKNQLNIIKL